jgi:hypothetical protein
MVHISPNKRWIDNPHRRVRPDHLIDIRQKALDAQSGDHAQAARTAEQHAAASLPRSPRRR